MWKKIDNHITALFLTSQISDLSPGEAVGLPSSQGVKMADLFQNRFLLLLV